MTDAEAKRCLEHRDSYIRQSGRWWESLNEFEKYGFRQGWNAAWETFTADVPLPSPPVEVEGTVE